VKASNTITKSVIAILAMMAATFAAARAAGIDSGAVSGLGMRNIGSAAMSGRIAAIAGRHERDGKITLFVGAASGGVWKSSDGGTSFEPVFDKQPVQSIGAIALDPRHPETVWVGTGESWTRNSVSIGDGIYKSTDGGENWTNMGLPNSERVARIIVSPKNSNIVYACVPGKLWSDSAERGLYRTTDGGAHWSLILKGGISRRDAHRSRWIPLNRTYSLPDFGIFAARAGRFGPAVTDRMHRQEARYFAPATAARRGRS